MTRSVEPPLTAWAGRPIDALRREWGVPRLLALAATTSTNDVARRLAEEGAPPFTTVLADEQTAGRGRRGRVWAAPHGTALLASILLRPAAPRTGKSHGDRGDTLSTTPLRVGLALARAIEIATGVVVRLKWPNDVLAPDGRKIAGILCEGAQGPAGSYVVAGIGVNVSQREADWAADLRSRAASLAQLAASPPDRAALAGALIAALRRAETRFGQPLNEEECAEWAGRDALRGRAVRVDDRLEGTADGITPEGALLLRGPAGPLVLWTGTVRTLETATAAASHDPSHPEDPR